MAKTAAKRVAKPARPKSGKSHTGTHRREGGTAVREIDQHQPGMPPPGPLKPSKAAKSRRDPPRGKLEGVRVPTSSRREDGSDGKYVYCIIRSAQPLSFGPLGLGPEPAEVQTIHYRDIAAVVSNTPIVVQDPTRENVLAHQRVNETVMQKHTVIPMSFGTVFKTDDDIMELLRSAYDAFSDVLNKMQEKFEFGLKVLWDRDQIIREIEDEDEDIRRLKSEISSQKGSTYFARMQYGRLIDAAL
jgi:hypothetical protein